jgi:predicted phosphoadenosine phosphosulfate sulfurtransferase
VAQKVVLDLLPTKSREIYETTYNRFMKWCEEKNIKTYSENVLLVYFADLAKKNKTIHIVVAIFNGESDFE